MRKIVALALCLMFALPVPTMADNCRRVVSTHYVAPVYHQANFVHHDNQIVVAKAFQVQVAAPYYLGVSDDYRQANFAKQVAEEYAKIVDVQRQQLALGTPVGQPLTAPTPVTKSKVGEILASRCAGCHAPGMTGPDLSGDPDKISETVRLKAFAAVARNEMPRGKPPLPNEEFNTLGEWAKGSPAVKIPQAAIKETSPEKSGK